MPPDPSNPEAHLLPQGTIVAGRYRVLQHVAEGGSCTVYQVRDMLTSEVRALKHLHPELTEDQPALLRIANEAVVMTLLDHPHVATVYDMGVDHTRPTPRYYVVLEWAEGGSLQTRYGAGVAFPAAEAILLGTQILAALEAAHARGIVHRDLKPANILLHGDGSALLADFGIAHVPDADPGIDGQVELVGSFRYMAPEQRIANAPPAPASDMYALATTLYEAVTGQNPVDLYTAENDSPRWDTVPSTLRPILQRATQLDPAARYATAREMSLALSEATAGDVAATTGAATPQ
ncbi:MAG: serine/threonine protein kinase [Myxococcota bacterium]